MRRSVRYRKKWGNGSYSLSVCEEATSVFAFRPTFSFIKRERSSRESVRPALARSYRNRFGFHHLLGRLPAPPCGLSRAAVQGSMAQRPSSDHKAIHTGCRHPTVHKFTRTSYSHSPFRERTGLTTSIYVVRAVLLCALSRVFRRSCPPPPPSCRALADGATSASGTRTYMTTTAQKGVELQPTGPASVS